MRCGETPDGMQGCVAIGQVRKHRCVEVLLSACALALEGLFEVPVGVALFATPACGFLVCVC